MREMQGESFAESFSPLCDKNVTYGRKPGRGVAAGREASLGLATSGWAGVLHDPAIANAAARRHASGAYKIGKRGKKV
jgi:hypothetical protein